MSDVLNGLGPGAGSVATWTEPEATIDGTRFFFGKLPAMRGFEVLEQIRVEIGDKADEELTAGIESLLKALLSLSRGFVETLRRELFKAVRYSNARAQTPQVLAGAEDTAFDGLEPIAVYEVLGRSLAVNFSDSFRRLGSTLAAAAGSTSPSSREASPDSSPP